MNYKIVLLEVIAILVAVLILNLPLAGAMQISIYYNVGGDNWVKWDDVSIEPENLINKDITVVNPGGDPFWNNPKVVINISSSASDLETVYIYKCKNLSPTDCVETKTPDMHSVIDSDLDLELGWSDVSQVIKSCSSYPSSCLEVANLFFLFKISEGGKITWIGVWNKIERRTYNFAQPYLFEYSLDELDLRAKIDFLTPIRDFIETYLTIPFNSEWVSSAIFPGANSLYELSVSSSGLQQASPSFDTKDHTTNEIEGISKDYSFVFPNASYGIINPVTLNLNPSFTCGLYGCERDLGESSTTCCYDCPCSDGYYCDGGTEGVCKLESLISLGLYETPQTVVTNCLEEHLINVTAIINYAPSGLALTRSEYKLNDTTYPTECEEILSDVYRCPITVPPMSDCREGEYRIGPNYLNFTISYTNGSNPKSRDLVVQFPDIVVGSFTCGENGCESGLGENTDNCCYDCGCPQGYCDIAGGAEPSTGTCRQDITVDNLQVKANPTHFYTHDITGDRVNLILQISNSPMSLGIIDDSCGLDCSYDGSQCYASCDVSCSKISSSDPNIYNASCSLTFRISGYNKTRDYSLIPTLNLSLTYNNGSFGKINKNFSKVFSTISVGSSWCGDLVCTPDDDSESCCYDCPCPEGYYCNTVSIEAPTAGDSCKAEGEIKIVVGDVEKTSFDYSDVSHFTNLTAHVENAPKSLKGSISCMFGDGSVYCYTDCERIGVDHILRCNLSIPVIDYKTSPLFDPGTKRIILGPNTINYSVTFNNGSDVISKELSADFPHLVINVKSRCGTGPGYLGTEERCDPYNRTLACEKDLGESYATCCCDCPCPSGKYCLIDESHPNGICKSVGEVQLIIDKFEPQPIKCEIPRDKKSCVFYKQLNVEAHIEPVANYSLVSGSYEIDGKESEMWSCIIGSDEPPWNKYNCSLALPNIESKTTTQPGEEPERDGRTEGRVVTGMAGTDLGKISPGLIAKNIKLSLSIESTGLLHTTVTDEGNFKISKIKSDALKLLEEQLESLEKSKGKLGKVKKFLIAALVIGAGWCGCTCIGICPWPSCKTCGLMYACAAAGLIPILIHIINKMNEIETQVNALNAAKNPGEMQIAEQSTSSIWWTIGSSIATLVCTVSLLRGEFKSEKAKVPAAGNPETTTTVPEKPPPGPEEVGDASVMLLDYYLAKILIPPLAIGSMSIGGEECYCFDIEAEPKKKWTDVDCPCDTVGKQSTKCMRKVGLLAVCEICTKEKNCPHA